MNMCGNIGEQAKHSFGILNASLRYMHVRIFMEVCMSHL